MLFISARGGSECCNKTTAAGFLFNYLIDSASPLPPGKQQRRDKRRGDTASPGFIAGNFEKSNIEAKH
jgi:hypothetical protein